MGVNVCRVACVSSAVLVVVNAPYEHAGCGAIFIGLIQVQTMTCDKAIQTQRRAILVVVVRAINIVVSNGDVHSTSLTGNAASEVVETAPLEVDR